MCTDRPRGPLDATRHHPRHRRDSRRDRAARASRTVSALLSPRTRIGKLRPRRGREWKGSNNGVMSVDVEVETTIERPPKVVAAFAGDPTNAPQWYANIRSVQWRTPPPVGVGSRMEFMAQFLGRRLVYTYEVAELEPG